MSAALAPSLRAGAHTAVSMQAKAAAPCPSSSSTPLRHSESPHALWAGAMALARVLRVVRMLGSVSGSGLYSSLASAGSEVAWEAGGLFSQLSLALGSGVSALRCTQGS